MKVVINADLCSRFFVDSVHVFVKGRSVAIVIIVSVSDEQVGVDHFVQ